MGSRTPENSPEKVPTPKIGRRKCAKSSTITQPYAGWLPWNLAKWCGTGSGGCEVKIHLRSKPKLPPAVLYNV